MLGRDIFPLQSRKRKQKMRDIFLLRAHNSPANTIVYSGASNFTDEQPFCRLTPAFARNLRSSEVAVLLLTESGEVVDPSHAWEVLSNAERPVPAGAGADRRCDSQVTEGQSGGSALQAFSFPRNDGLFGNSVLRETE